MHPSFCLAFFSGALYAQVTEPTDRSDVRRIHPTAMSLPTHKKLPLNPPPTPPYPPSHTPTCACALAADPLVRAVLCERLGVLVRRSARCHKHDGNDSCGYCGGGGRGDLRGHPKRPEDRGGPRERPSEASAHGREVRIAECWSGEAREQRCDACEQQAAQRMKLASLFM